MLRPVSQLAAAEGSRAICSAGLGWSVRRSPHIIGSYK